MTSNVTNVVRCLRPYCKNNVEYDSDFPQDTLVTCNNVNCLLHMNRLCELSADISEMTRSYKNNIINVHNDIAQLTQIRDNLEEIKTAITILIP